MVVLARGHSIAKWRKASNTAQFTYRHVFSLLRLRLLAVHYVVHLVDETDDYFRYFVCYEYAKRNNLQNQITLHLKPPCSINLKFFTSFFKIGLFCACSFVFVIVCLQDYIKSKRCYWITAIHYTEKKVHKLNKNIEPYILPIDMKIHPGFVLLYLDERLK